MKNLNKFKGTSLLLVIGFLLASCGGGTPATPTTDPNLLFTQVAETVAASIAETAAAMPTSTPIPTQEPTATMIPLPTTDPNAVPTESPVQPGYPTPTVQRYGDAALWTAQSPADGYVVKSGTIFTFHGCMHNIGTTTWDPKYSLKYDSGPNLWPKQTSWPIPQEIKPGEKWCYDLSASAPSTLGLQTTRWWFYNDKTRIYEVYFTYTVIP